MRRPGRSLLLAALAGAAALLTLSCRSAAPPSIFFVVIDTARQDHVSAYGADPRITPNVDALAREGVLYRNAHAVAPWTLPSHASMFTGLLPAEHGASWSFFRDAASIKDVMERPLALREPERLLARRLADAGYATIGISANPW